MGIYDTRLASLRKLMADSATDLVILGPSTNMLWLTGVDPHGDERPVLTVVSADFAGFLMPALNADMARQHTDLPFFEWADAQGPAEALSALLDAADAKRPGLSIVLDETMRADFALMVLDAMDSPMRRFTADTIGRLRAMKDETEADLLRTCARLNDDAVRHAMTQLKVGMTELDLQAILHDYYKAHGAAPEFTIIGFGANGAFPHHHTGDTVLTDDMAVLIDTGCRIGGYPSDMTRSFWFGPNEPEEYKTVRRVVNAAVEAAMDAARPGVKACDVDAAARKVIEDAGYGPRFVHRLGHGLGIDVHETPYITSTAETVLEAGNVFSIEPGIYLTGNFGVRLEEIVILREKGPEIFSGLERLLDL
ncbi:Xaa-Pro peptidase family protein [Cereibacter sphaeroides]|nr:Xaa-Pro peptidase family protein [Cereibacter sphaeroides]